MKIDHIGIAVNNLEEAIKLYTESLGLSVSQVEIITQQKVRLAIIPIGDSQIELLESTDSQGPIAKYIDNRGEGIHHLALEVDDISATLAILKDNEVPLIDDQPIIGAHGTKIAFIHPKGAKALIELVEH